MKVTILGCGTSGGVPRIGNVWGACDPKNPKNRRRRVAILVEQGDGRILVDTSPDLREQLLDTRVDTLGGVLYTHDHADHTHGIDDLRAPVQIYANKETLEVLGHRFDYIFKSKLGYRAICEVNEITGPFEVGGIKVTPFLQEHGPITSLGFRFGKVAYSTDLNGLPEASWKILEGVDTWIVDALRPHPHLDKTLEWIERLKPRRAILTHMTWDMDYETLKRELPGGVEPGYDGMVIEV